MPVTVEEQYAEYAAGELELWLRQNRTGPGWPWRGYETEVEDLTVRYLTGCGWQPGMRHPVFAAVADGVHVGAVVAWRRVTGEEPGGGARLDAATAELAAKWAGGVDRLRRAG